MNPKHKAKHVAAKPTYKLLGKSMELAESVDRCSSVEILPEKEFIQWAAIRVYDPSGDRIFKGWDHASCTDQIHNESDYADNLCLWQREEGFVTSLGRFVDRFEAHIITKGEPGWLESWMLRNDERYGCREEN